MTRVGGADQCECFAVQYTDVRGQCTSYKDAERIGAHLQVSVEMSEGGDTGE